MGTANLKPYGITAGEEEEELKLEEEDGIFIQEKLCDLTSCGKLKRLQSPPGSIMEVV